MSSAPFAPSAPVPLGRPEPVQPPARPARRRRRHNLVLASFFVMVLIPVVGVAAYLWGIAEDQFASTVAFSVRKEENSSAIELLGGITEISGSSSSDTDILYEFIRSQKLVSALDDRLDLAAIWSKPAHDPYFAYDPAGTIEDLVDYWQRMVRVYYDSSSRLIELRVLAFTPEDATRVAEAIFSESSNMINALSDQAREDAVRHAREELERAVERLKGAREAVTRYRNENQMVDPTIDLNTQTTLLGNLQAQLAEALIELDLLAETTRESDPRVAQARRRVEVIRAHIAEERRKRGLVGADAEAEVFATLIGEYERLVVDREFAERSYTAALAAHDAAQAEARRQSRYLAAHIQPTRAERSAYPRRGLTLALFGLIAFLAWVVTVLVGYSLRDRR